MTRNGARLDHAGGAAHERHDARKFYGKYRGTVINNIDPMQMGRIMVQVPDVARADPVELGDAVLAGRRQADGRRSIVRRSAPACGSSSSRATPTTRSGPAAARARAADVPALALATQSRCRRHRSCRRAAQVTC